MKQMQIFFHNIAIFELLSTIKSQGIPDDKQYETILGISWCLVYSMKKKLMYFMKSHIGLEKN